MNSDQKNILLQQLFEQITESIIVSGENGKIVLINPATQKLFGYKPDELAGKDIEVLMPDRYRKKHMHHRAHFNQNPHSRPMGIGMDLYALKKDGSEFPVEISLSPFRAEGIQYLLVFIIDITARKKIEQEVISHQKSLEKLTMELEVKVEDRTKILKEALTEVEKSRMDLSEALEKEKELNELKSRFLSMASHEFRTPLTTILSSAMLINEYPESNQFEKRKKHVEKIKSAVENLNDILGDFLSLSRIEEGRVKADLKNFRLPQLVNDVRDDVQGLCKKDQQIDYVHEGDETVFLDPKLTRNILINLISNAIKFSNEGSAISVKSSSGPNGVSISVADQGIGISEGDKEHLFQRFFRGENASNIQGTGLGLNIVSKYVELMNGTINFDSKLEKGSTFTLFFPVKK